MHLIRRLGWCQQSCDVNRCSPSWLMCTSVSFRASRTILRRSTRANESSLDQGLSQKPQVQLGVPSPTEPTRSQCRPKAAVSAALGTHRRERRDADRRERRPCAVRPPSPHER